VTKTILVAPGCGHMLKDVREGLISKGRDGLCSDCAHRLGFRRSEVLPWTNVDELNDQLRDAAEVESERLWRLWYGDNGKQDALVALKIDNGKKWATAKHVSRATRRRRIVAKIRYLRRVTEERVRRLYNLRADLRAFDKYAPSSGPVDDQ